MSKTAMFKLLLLVALLTEGVDRNYSYHMRGMAADMSPSSRRAWIEIRVEVDPTAYTMSPSSRRAWIEILSLGFLIFEHLVALLTEGVDRNNANENEANGTEGRPPHGGRG